jgi:hypothetical protein
MSRASSALRMTRGVMKTISSVRWLWLLVLRKRLPRTGMSPSSGTLSTAWVEPSWISPPRTTVWPLVTFTLLAIRRCAMIGFWSWRATTSCTRLTSCDTSRVTTLLLLIRGRTSRMSRSRYDYC